MLFRRGEPIVEKGHKPLIHATGILHLPSEDRSHALQGESRSDCRNGTSSSLTTLRYVAASVNVVQYELVYHNGTDSSCRALTRYVATLVNAAPWELVHNNGFFAIEEDAFVSADVRSTNSTQVPKTVSRLLDVAISHTAWILNPTR
eukprot:CAMPEP_0194067412 /NCGR_PEP_ID=MMETSP0009_2-20130614/86544_1 /TAXON_ID=210454 /ORGANISM="Grammatophora oceanica, Strain CCMP 410" /LENGTH=146 /DNA_ID=CAMNT_0038720433 /DNA_START=1073 /DNA_END=1513 /DNA_ORIENTATION=-